MHYFNHLQEYHLYFFVLKIKLQPCIGDQAEIMFVCWSSTILEIRFLEWVIHGITHDWKAASKDWINFSQKAKAKFMPHCWNLLGPVLICTYFQIAETRNRSCMLHLKVKRKLVSVMTRLNTTGGDHRLYFSNVAYMWRLVWRNSANLNIYGFHPICLEEPPLSQ